MSKKIAALLIFAAFLLTLYAIAPQNAGAQATIVLKYANFPPVPYFPVRSDGEMGKRG